MVVFFESLGLGAKAVNGHFLNFVIIQSSFHSAVIFFVIFLDHWSEIIVKQFFAQKIA